LDDDGQKAIGDVLRMAMYSKKFKPKIKPLLDSISSDRRKLLYACRKECCRKKRKKNIIQTGGSIGLILATVLPFLVPLIFGKK
jgi:uncharacterized membrane protein